MTVVSAPQSIEFPRLARLGVRVRREDAAPKPIPSKPYLVTDRHLRHVGKDCLVAFEANLYAVPAAKVFPRQLVEVRASSANDGDRLKRA